MKVEFKDLLVTCLIFITIILTSCQNRNETEELLGYVQEEELGAYSFGNPNFDFEENELIYTGELLRIPYHVEGLSQNIVAEFGWFLFVDGLPQPTKLMTSTGDIFREMAYMHEFSLSYQERYEFYVMFYPHSGRIGETMMSVGTAMFAPSFIPRDVYYPFFGFFHNLSSTMPGEISINYNIEHKLIGKIIDNLQPISQEILEAEEKWLAEWIGPDVDLELDLQSFPRMNISPRDSDFQLMYEGAIFVEEGHVNFTFLTYGGEEARNRITFFVNHQPVQVNGFDYLEVQMENGQMLKLEISLELENLDTFNTIYALRSVAGMDYESYDVFKTPTLLLINE